MWLVPEKMSSSPDAASRRYTTRGAPAAGSAADQSRDHHEHDGPIVVHVRDARTGDIEVFSGTSQTRLRDKDLAARIARAIA